MGTACRKKPAEYRKSLDRLLRDLKPSGTAQPAWKARYPEAALLAPVTQRMSA